MGCWTYPEIRPFLPALRMYQLKTRLLVIKKGVEEQFECLVALRPILRSNTEENHVSGADRGIDDRGTARDVFLSEQPARGEHSSFRVYRHCAVAAGGLESGAVFKPERNLLR